MIRFCYYLHCCGIVYENAVMKKLKSREAKEVMHTVCPHYCLKLTQNQQLKLRHSKNRTVKGKYSTYLDSLTT